MNTDCVLVFDLGNRHWRAALVDDRGGLIAKVSRPAPRTEPQMPADTWWRGLQQLHAALCVQSPEHQPSALALASIGRCTLFLDADQQPLHDALTYRHIASAPKAREIAMSQGGAVSVHHHAARYAWLRQHHANKAQDTRLILDVKTDLIRRLSGELVRDALSDRQHHDDAERDQALFRYVGFDSARQPFIRPPNVIAATVQSGLPASLATLAGIPIILGASSEWCASIGAGAVRAWQGFLLSDEEEYSGVLHRYEHQVSGLYSAAWHEQGHFCGGPQQHGWPDLRWWAALSQRSLDDVADLDDWLAKPNSGDTPLYLPYLQGELAPFWQANLRAQFHGLEASHHGLSLLHAIVEGMGFANRHLLSQVGLDSVEEFVVAGELSASDHFCQTKANTLGRTIKRRVSENATLLGAAMNAWVAMRRYSSLLLMNRELGLTEDVFYPDFERRGQLEARYEEFLLLQHAAVQKAQQR